MLFNQKRKVDDVSIHGIIIKQNEKRNFNSDMYLKYDKYEQVDYIELQNSTV